jgi:hypothetical protein
MMCGGILTYIKTIHDGTGYTRIIICDSCHLRVQQAPGSGEHYMISQMLPDDRFDVIIGVC